MQSYAHNKSNYVFVRRKRTRSVDIRRADEFYPQSSSSLSSQERALHFVGADRTSVCRCSDPGWRNERISSVRSESRHLAAGLRLYVDRHNLVSCAMADFHEYNRSRKADWATEGVYVDDFHYTSRDKNVVCRCSQPRKHSYSAPRNPEIVEQCAAFFCLHKGKTTVSKDQWKGVDGDTPPSYSASVNTVPGHNSNSLSSSSRHVEERVQSRSSLETRMRDTAERIASIIPGRRRAWTSESQSDMPPQVWRSARVSALTPRPGTSSLGSTPLGSASPSTRASSPAVSRTRTQRFDSVFNTSSIYARAQAINIGVFPGSYPDSRTSKAGATTGVQGLYTNNRTPPTDTNASALYEKEDNETSGSSRSPPFGYDQWYQTRLPNQAFEKDDDELSLPSFYIDRDTSDPFGIDNHGMSVRTSVAELPARRSPVELPAMRARQRNTETLKKLEGRVHDTRSELEAKRYSVRCTQAPMGFRSYIAFTT